MDIICRERSCVFNKGFSCTSKTILIGDKINCTDYQKKDELKNDSLDTNLFVSKNAEIPATKNEKLQKGNKISANDFSKIQELGEVVSQNQNANEISESIDFKNADTILKNDKKIKELAGDNLENSDFVFANNSEEVSNLSLGEKSFDNSNFNFKNQNQNNSKNESKISIKDLRTEISEELNRHVKSIDNALQRVKRKLERYLEIREISF